MKYMGVFFVYFSKLYILFKRTYVWNSLSLSEFCSNSILLVLKSVAWEYITDLIYWRWEINYWLLMSLHWFVSKASGWGDAIMPTLASGPRWMQFQSQQKHPSIASFYICTFLQSKLSHKSTCSLFKTTTYVMTLMMLSNVPRLFRRAVLWRDTFWQILEVRFPTCVFVICQIPSYLLGFKPKTEWDTCHSS